MLKLPLSTKLNKQLPKKAIYAKFKLKTAIKEKFDADVSKIVFINEVSPTTTTIAKGEHIESFFVLLVSLKRELFDEKSILLLPKLIDQHMLFVLEYGERAKLAVFHGKLHQTEWMPVEELSIELKGLNFDTVWEHIIVQVGGVEIAQGRTLEEQLLIDEQRTKLEKQIASLERQARAEKQPRRKLELVQEIKKLEKLK
jgi:hypothetical protein